MERVDVTVFGAFTSSMSDASLDVRGDSPTCQAVHESMHMSITLSPIQTVDIYHCIHVPFISHLFLPQAILSFLHPSPSRSPAKLLLSLHSVSIAPSSYSPFRPHTSFCPQSLSSSSPCFLSPCISPQLPHSLRASLFIHHLHIILLQSILSLSAVLLWFQATFALSFFFFLLDTQGCVSVGNEAQAGATEKTTRSKLVSLTTAREETTEMKPPEIQLTDY